MRQPSDNSAGNKIRLRAPLIGFVLAVLICALTPFNNIYRQATPLGGGHFPLAPFYILVWLTLISALWERWRKHSRLFTGKELIVIWALLLVVSGIAYTGLMRTFFINLTAPLHFASAENRWDEVLWPLLPKALYPKDMGAVADLYNGLRGGRQMGFWELMTQIPWSAWVAPLACWAVFILLCYWVMICMVTMISRQALTNERMNFPLMRVPQILGQAHDQGKLLDFLGNRYLLFGIAVPVCLHLINGLHFYFSSVPQIPTLVLAGSYFGKSGLFAGFAKLKIFIYPAFIGFAFLASKQISLSFWFFFLAGGLLFGLLGIFGWHVPASALGVTFGPTISRPEETQMIGAFVVFFLFLAWLARYHFWGVARNSLRMGSHDAHGDTGESAERFAFWGVIIGTTAIVAWFWFFGMQVHTALLIIGVFFMFTLVAMRVICQGGVAYFTLTAAPLDGLLAVFGSQLFTKAGLLLAGAAQKVLFVDLRESLMPSLLHARQVTRGHISRRLVVTALLVGLVSAVVVSGGAMLAMYYKFGIRELSVDWAARSTVSVYDNLFHLMETPVLPNQWVITFVAAGALVMAALVVCYHRFYWWPLHPIGYLMAYSSAMRILWVSFFIGWVCNALCMRYGGVVVFKKVRFFFFGLIIGDFLMGGTWALIGLFSMSSYQVLPG